MQFCCISWTWVGYVQFCLGLRQPPPSVKLTGDQINGRFECTWMSAYVWSHEGLATLGQMSGRVGCLLLYFINAAGSFTKFTKLSVVYNKRCRNHFATLRLHQSSIFCIDLYLLLTELPGPCGSVGSTIFTVSSNHWFLRARLQICHPRCLPSYSAETWLFNEISFECSKMIVAVIQIKTFNNKAVCSYRSNSLNYFSLSCLLVSIFGSRDTC